MKIHWFKLHSAPLRGKIDNFRLKHKIYCEILSYWYCFTQLGAVSCTPKSRTNLFLEIKSFPDGLCRVLLASKENFLINNWFQIKCPLNLFDSLTIRTLASWIFVINLPLISEAAMLIVFLIDHNWNFRTTILAMNKSNYFFQYNLESTVTLSKVQPGRK